MLDALVQKHLDELDNLNADIDEAIDKAIQDINIDSLMTDPTFYMSEFSAYVRDEIILPRVEAAVRIGERFSEKVKNKDVTVDPSKNPTKNNDKLRSENGNKVSE